MRKKVEIKTVDGGTSPVKSTKGSACYDLFARKIEKVTPHYYKIYLGITSDIPEGYLAEVFSRSSVTDTGWGLANSVGVIDSDFKNKEWQARFRPFYNGEREMVFPFKGGDRVAQFRIVKEDTIKIDGVVVLDNKREGGHGHTGR